MEWHEYRSWQLWEDRYSGNLAVFCSDERFAAATLEFLRRALNMERCDLMVIAGGPAFIAQNEPNLMERLRLLVNAHRVRRIALITHADCGYYKNRHRAVAEAVWQKQLDDLQEAVQRLQHLLAGKEVRGFTAQLDKTDIVFAEMGKD